ncbi:VOC family protein [Amylibacter sp. SFDW26]|uniref:VOC family protein n=1 Tax=Amylibacter sp. SFDW26 TaxID=2652722 RepID=UPI0012620C62|nr:VOC family protein [Amylibacter sp. SFDW26]KAB7613747.1 VOC family protein [Amylibacter sp. SFDW26]
MSDVYLEHLNVTVSDLEKTAAVLCEIFDWHVRWKGASLDNGKSYHIGGDKSYLALYSKGGTELPADNYSTPGSLNHIGVVVSDIKAVEKKVIAAGYEPHSHDDYEPGLRFYFKGPDRIEIEVVSYVN